ncbi:MAG: bifunctional YncE family protein/alkaline phosphatase family protein [Bryobacteraceae bacterium]
MLDRNRIILAVFAVAAAGSAILSSQSAGRVSVGRQADGKFLLSSGWRLAPAGRQIPLDTLPMSTALSPDGKFLLVLNGGYKPPSVSVLDVATMRELSRVPVADGWLGLAFTPNGRMVYVGGGQQAAVFEFSFSPAGELKPARTLEIKSKADRTAEDFIGDVAVSPDGRLIYAADLYRNSIAVINPQSGRVIERYKCGRRPYRILFHPDGKSYLVSSWADGMVSQYDANAGTEISKIRLGPHTTDMVFRAKTTTDEAAADQPGLRLFVTASNTNTVFVVGLNDAKDMRLLESINVTLTPRHPLGMTPSALALSPDRNRLFIVCSDANAVAVAAIDGERSRVSGFIPVGWYPTAARTLPDGRLIVLNGKGGGSYANPNGPSPARLQTPSHDGVRSDGYVGVLQTGSASVIDAFDEAKLEEYSKTALDVTPYRDRQVLDRWFVGSDKIFARPNQPSPIEHVLYIVKENRTYDQVLGDLGRGNGDPSLTLFKEEASVNHRKLANEFVLFDNYYVNADVSADGHNWATAAIAPDYTQKLWPSRYGKRRLTYDFEGGEPANTPPAGYIWTQVLSAGLSMRNYGYFVQNIKDAKLGGEQVDEARDRALEPVTNEFYRGFDLDYPDVERAKTFLKDLAKFESEGRMPRFLILRLGNDHTSGTTPGKIAPLSAFADNDYALGMIVEGLSKSTFWPKTAVFVTEDDAQNGPDHVDSHRSPAYVISPYTRRGLIDSTMYTQASMLRTMELILGLRPMTHFDGGATPMTAAFSNEPDLRPYEAAKPRRSLTERNPARSETAARSAKMDFDEADEADDDELNDVLWRAIRKSDPPVPMRSYFSRRRAGR